MRTGSLLHTLARKAALCSALSSLAVASTLHAESTPTINVRAPAGFENIIAERTVLVDLYFGEKKRGEVQVSVSPGSLRFLDPERVLALLPPLTSETPVLNALRDRDLPTNASLRCTDSVDRTTCGRVVPSPIAVIYDPERFRVDVSLRPELVAVPAATSPQFLPPPPRSLSAVNSVSAVVSGDTERSEAYLSLFDQLVVGTGEQRARAELTYASGIGIEVDRADFEWDRPGVRYSLGALWAPGTAVAGRRKFVGGAIERQIDTRLDKDLMLGSPIVFYLDQRARVDVLRDGKVLASAVYDAGSQRIDSSAFPDGSYTIVLRVAEPGRPVREERRFFAKSRQIPAVGEVDYFLFGGVLTDGRGVYDPHAGAGLVQGGAAFRIARRWALAGNVELAGGALTGELSATFLSPLAQMRATALVGTAGTRGGIVQLNSSGMSRFNFNLDLRRITASRYAPNDTLIDPSQMSWLAQSAFDGLDANYTQMGGLFSYTLANVRLLASGFYRRDAERESSYSFGPSLEWDVVRRGSLTLTLRSDLTMTERGSAGFVGIDLRLLGPQLTASALAGARVSSIDPTRGDGAVASVAGSWARSAAGGDLDIGAGIEHQPDRTNAFLSGDFRHPVGSVQADVVRAEGLDSEATQYSLGLQTTFAAGAGGVRAAGKTASEAFVVARVNGAGPQDTFDVLVNDQLATSVTGGGAVTLALPPYRKYGVRIRPTGERLLAYDNDTETVSLYPGTVANVEWDVAPITIKIGRLMNAAGRPIANAVITSHGVWAETDADGRFQIEAPDNAEVSVTLPSGIMFAAALPSGLASNGVSPLGEIVCCGPSARLSSANQVNLEIEREMDR